MESVVMKCKECGMIMSPQQVSEILTDLVDGLKPVRICDDCIEYEERSYAEFHSRKFREKYQKNLE